MAQMFYITREIHEFNNKSSDDNGRRGEEEI